MNIYQPGTPPVTQPAWPYGVKFTCLRCGCIFGPTQDIDFSFFAVPGRYTASLFCPTCGHGVSADRPFPPEGAP